VRSEFVLKNHEKYILIFYFFILIYAQVSVLTKIHGEKNQILIVYFWEFFQVEAKIWKNALFCLIPQHHMQLQVQDFQQYLTMVGTIWKQCGGNSKVCRFCVPECLLNLSRGFFCVLVFSLFLLF
jgi:hypothetical protein